MADELSWNKLVEIEPELGELLNQIRAIKDDPEKPSFCANWEWYGVIRTSDLTFKETMTRLVGWKAVKQDPILRSEQAYNLAYKTLYAALPDCRNCNCL